MGIAATGLAVVLGPGADMPVHLSVLLGAVRVVSRNVGALLPLVVVQTNCLVSEVGDEVGL